ncbi:MAG: DUF885 domain-containing protein [Proteobacteria bacterium]|nr:DUF885 domain-containing protein [Pseudomonadota bacterium]
MTMHRSIVIAIIVALGAITACTMADNATTAAPIEVEQSSEWDLFLSAFLDDYFAINPTFAVYQGKHEFDGRLPDWSEQGLKKQIENRKKAIAGARAIDASKLTEAHQHERDYLISVLEGDLFWIEQVDWPHKNPAYYLNRLDPNVYIARPYASAEIRMRAFIAYAKNIPAAADHIKANLRLPLPKTYLKLATAGFSGYANYYPGDAKAAFASVDDEGLQSQFDAAADAAATAMQNLSDHLSSVPATIDGFSMGADNFSGMISKTEGVNISLDELEAIGRADLKRNQVALAEACSRFAPGKSIVDCMAKMAANKPLDGPVQEARDQLPPLRAFLIEMDIVSIPGTETALVEESPPYNRQNSAYIDIPGPYETGLPSVYYISPPDPTWDAETRAAYIPGKMDLLGTSIHEIWPGHFLNFLHSNRAESLLGKLFVGYAFAEGWAHYAEEMMVDAGLHDGDAETRIGQLANALLRNCRYISAIGLHARGMTVEQSFEMFRRECYQDIGTATQQAARGTYDPAYLNYTMGKLMIRKLREDWTATRGGRDAWKAFHDEFLSYGGPPIPMVRKAMMKESEAKAVF